MPPVDGSKTVLKIRLFGSIGVAVNGEAIPALISRRGLLLLAQLTLRANREVDRDAIAGVLWPESERGHALANLRRILTDLRKSLGAASERLQSPNSHTLLFQLQLHEADVLIFDHCVRRRDAEISEIERAVDLYTAPLLEGCYSHGAIQEQDIRRNPILPCWSALQPNSDKPD